MDNEIIERVLKEHREELSKKYDEEKVELLVRRFRRKIYNHEAQRRREAKFSKLSGPEQDFLRIEKLNRLAKRKNALVIHVYKTFYHRAILKTEGGDKLRYYFNFGSWRRS